MRARAGRLKHRPLIVLALLALAACETAAPPPPTPAPQAALQPPQPSIARPEPRLYREEGNASWYGAPHHGRTTANGETFDKEALTAAHRSLPFDTRLRVTNLENGRSVVVVVNDRGPYVPDRLIDLSEAAARRLAFTEDGVAPVRIEELP